MNKPCKAAVPEPIRGRIAARRCGLLALSWCAFALSLAAFAGACGSGTHSIAGGASTDGNSDVSPPVQSSSGSSSMEGGDDGPTDAPIDAGSGEVLPGGGSCPTRGDAASCPVPPAGFAFPGAPAAPGYWVGCESTICSSLTSCTTCTCVDGDAGGVWECTNNDGFQEADGAPTPYCALNSGPRDAGTDAAGPTVRCTTAYPSCTPPSPGGQSPGWLCCRVSSVGGTRMLSCLASDGGVMIY